MTAAPMTPARQAQAGFSLVEVMVTIVLIAIAMLSLVPVMLMVARSSTTATTLAQRSAVVTGEVERIEAVPFTTLAVGNTCTTFSSAAFPHTRCINITSVNSQTKRITIIVTPLNGVRADTTVVERHKSGGYNPLNP